MTDMADANELQRAIRPTGVFNIKKTAADFCSPQCIMDNTGSLKWAMICCTFCRFNYEFIVSKTKYQIHQRSNSFSQNIRDILHQS